MYSELGLLEIAQRVGGIKLEKQDDCGRKAKAMQLFTECIQAGLRVCWRIESIEDQEGWYYCSRSEQLRPSRCDFHRSQSQLLRTSPI